MDWQLAITLGAIALAGCYFVQEQLSRLAKFEGRRLRRQLWLRESG